jgi:tetratricopeptide (TPR) repeat protein
MGKNKNKNKFAVNIDDDSNTDININVNFNKNTKNIFDALNDDNINNVHANTNKADNNNADNAYNETSKYFDLALNYDDNNDFDLAKDYYLKSIEFDSEDKIKGISSHNLALLYENYFDDIEQAKKYYIIGSKYNCRDSNCNIGLIYYSNKEYKEAKDYFKKYIELGGIDMFDKYAKCCSELNSYQEGLHYMTYHLMLKNADKTEQKLFRKLLIQQNFDK